MVGRRPRMNGEGKPILSLDIDGTLGDYHGHFLWFAEAWLDKKMPDPTDINPGMPLHKFMGVSLRVYRECKLAYRQGGLKRFMPCYPGAAELAADARRLGAEVWICTTRPYLRLDNIDPDTREWLRRNRIQYDAVLFGDDKYKELQRQAGWRVGAVFEDLPEQCDKAWSLGFDVWIRDQPYNRHYNEFIGRAPRVHDCWEMLEIVRRNIDSWKGKAREQ